MIYIKRDEIEKPHFFYSKEYEKLNDQLHDHYKKSQRERSQKRYNLYNLPNHINKDIYLSFNKKCAYCETKIEEDSKDFFASIDHFRPKSNARGFEKNATALDHYWWLSYEWENMYLSCPDCNKYKSSWFPVEGKRAKPLTSYDSIVKNEINLILDPCNNIVEDHLEYDFNSGIISGQSKKGDATIEILHLNRRDLIESRLEALRYEYNNWEKILHDYRRGNVNEYNNLLVYWEGLFKNTSGVDFLGVRRALILDRLNNYPELRKTIPYLDLKFQEGPPSDGLPLTTSAEIDNINLEEFAKEKATIIETKSNAKSVGKTIKKDNDHDLLEIKTLLRNVYIEKIELKNYKCFDYLEVDVSKIKAYDKEPWLVFLGENGVGKSSLIKAVAIALMGQDYLDTLDLDPSRILKYRKHSGHIKVYGSNKDEIFEVTFNKNSTQLISNIKQPPCYLLGYGSTRLLPKGVLMPKTNIEFVKTKNLFDYSISLSNAKEWLLDIKKSDFNQVALSLKDLLLLNDDDLIKRSKIKNCIYINNIKNDIDDLSDGYKSIFAITVDIIKTLSKNNLAFETAEGIVLIDEIGTHLHPRWKMEVVKRLRKTFPKIQFIVTTHEPLCLRGLNQYEVLVLKRNDEGEIIAINDLPDPSDFRVDQLLTSEYFGLNSTLDFETEEKFKEYYALLVKEDKKPEDEETIIRLSQELPNKIGNDIRDELVYHVIDELLAKQIKDKGFKLADDNIKEEAVKRVKEIWDFIDKND